MIVVSIKSDWIAEIIKAVEKHIKTVDTTEGFYVTDTRHNDDLGTYGGKETEYDSPDFPPVTMCLYGFPMTAPDGCSDRNLIKDGHDVMSLIQEYVVDEYETIKNDGYPDLRLVAGYEIAHDYGSEIDKPPSVWLTVRFEIEPIW